MVVFGAINIDLLALASSDAQIGDSTPGVLRQMAGGVGRNIAENLARLGIRTTIASSVGEDSFGTEIMAQAQAAGINVANVNVSKEFPTATYTAVHNSDGELLHAVSDMRLFDQLNLELNESLLAAMQDADAIVVDANLPEMLITKIVQHAKPHSVFADTVSNKKGIRLLPVLPSLALLKVNRTEACALTGCEGSVADAELLDKLLQLGVPQVLLTKGREGATLAADQYSIDQPAPVLANIVSTNGAGDALFSGLLAAKLYGFDQSEQLRWGMVAASHSLNVDSAVAKTLTYDSIINTALEKPK